ncbi:hypothetical protein HNR23_001311 [Nocardiopsis mwathae]|uniref:DUF397 domain-containing protein n=1 Tax=Nocardiopsis mwathae TaxID=1472723 RepID=A0A7W9YHC7_9ACTN|nr:DUF397 domain-containing protein [Nocardiopsis mwathae]MBB6171251.1 hypothetical protein [Nocardiopsis mwathae]
MVRKSPQPLGRTSSYSGGGKECVEIAQAARASLVRDSKHPERGHLSFGFPEWEAFASSVKEGEIDG